MTFALHQRVVLTRDLPAEGLRTGDVGVIVDHYPAKEDVPEGYELELFAVTGRTVAVVSVPATAIPRSPSSRGPERTRLRASLTHPSSR
jgi:hypothetical protein